MTNKQNLENKKFFFTENNFKLCFPLEKLVKMLPIIKIQKMFSISIQ